MTDPATLLVVDDLASNRKLLRKMLQKTGHRIIEAASGSEAIDTFSSQAVDLVLMDIMMPGMDGQTAVEHIKRLSADKHIPIIYVTALNSAEAQQQALAAGGDDFISKPVDQTVLLAKIGAHLRIRGLYKRIQEQNERLNLHNLRLQREHELVNHFFENALARSLLDPNFIRYHLSPASAFNGDLLLSQPGVLGNLYLLVGDFTGHGLAASIGSLPVAQTFFDQARHSPELGRLAAEINRQIGELLPDDMFFAANLMEISPCGRHIQLWSGGMPPVYIAKGNGQLTTIEPRHMPLGVLDEEKFDPFSQGFSIAEGDLIYLYSDGLIESTDDHKQPFGEERLRALLATTGPEQRFEGVLAALKAYSGEHSQDDDIALIELNCRGLGAMDLRPAPKQEEENHAPLPLQIKVTLNPSHLRQAHTVTHLTDMLAAQPGLRPHREVIYTLLAETLNNAIEHGLLQIKPKLLCCDAELSQFYQLRQQHLEQLADGRVTIEVTISEEAEGGLLRLSVVDSGPGHVPDHIEPSGESFSGRGLMLLKSLCQSVTFNAKGNGIELTYRL